MQTFLPYSDFAQSAECLDNKRLGKQRVECLQILNALQTMARVPNQVVGWMNHPAVLMWEGYSDALGAYKDIIIWEWLRRGFKNTISFSFDAMDGSTFAHYSIDNNQIKLPPWLGNKAFHASHRSNLLRKDPMWYGQFGWKEANDLPYVWPTNTDKIFIQYEK